VPRKKGTQPLTLIVVPHSERAPVSFRVPTWILPLVPLFVLSLVVATVFFAVRARRLDQQVQDLQQEQTVQTAREREMRNTILVQQEEVLGLSQQVNEFEDELTGINALSDQIRDLLGVATPALTAVPTPTGYEPDNPLESLARSSRFAGLDSDARGGGTIQSLSNEGMGMAMEKVQDVIGMQVTLPGALREMVDLREQVLARLEKIEPDKRTTRADLENQLKLLAAAPHIWPTECRQITSKFGYRTMWGKLEFHKGIDIAVWYGEVHATKDGTVVEAHWRSTYGRTIVIEHEMGFSTLYGHLSKLLVSEGDKISAGDVIGISGNSGRSSGPHLHYEIRLNDTPVDPFKYLDTEAPTAEGL
jgi:murein DD-endopeptidase MepM/ murein hydrolase activator NlpD